MTRNEHAGCLRTGRFSEVGRLYSVTSVVEGRLPIFGNWQLGRIVVHEFRRAEADGLVCSFAWVVMPDHFHWLFELRSGSLDALIKRVKARSAIEYNRATQGRGRIWQKGFHDRAIRYEEDVQDVARYIVANPLRAGLVSRLGNYPLWDAVWI
ncbi:REP-associated tyrosine transposase [Pseudomonas huanghezhanensis]|uniref:REP-associated tyrosine transposase n=1 Tax=Pseudomonas huanghezhanensis TaxID=3002903 RepID=UPI0022859065|nr:transposase [Pseudomonas sp. BSw22131]